MGRIGFVALLAFVLLAGGCAAKGGGEVRSPQEQERALADRIAVGLEALAKGEPERARRHLSRALELAPKSGKAHAAMAALYRYEMDDEREEAHYRKALRYEPGFSRARNNYAILLYRQGRYRDAIRQLEKATNDTSYDQRSIAFLNLGRCYVKIGEFDKAQAALERSVRLDSSQVDVFLELADLNFRMGRRDIALHYLQGYESRGRHTPQSLWLGIRLAHLAGKQEILSGYELQLESLFKESPEHAEWKAWRDAGRSGKAVQP